MTHSNRSPSSEHGKVAHAPRDGGRGEAAAEGAPALQELVLRRALVADPARARHRQDQAEGPRGRDSEEGGHDGGGAARDGHSAATVGQVGK